MTAIRGALASAQASGNIVTLDVNNAGNSMLSTMLDNNETTSTTAATACVIDTTYDDIADDGVIPSISTSAMAPPRRPAPT